MPGIEFAVTFFVGCGIFAIAVLPEPELQQRRRLAVVAASFVGVGLIGYFLDEIVFTALGAATIPPLTLYYRTKDQRKRIETLEGKNEELIEAVRKREETSTSLRTAIDRLRDDVTNLRDLDTTHLQALMDIARDNLTSVVESLWEFYRLELVRVYAEPPTDVKIHQTRLVVIFSLMKMILMSYCQSEDELAATLDGLEMSGRMKRKIISEYKQVHAEFRD